MTSQENNYSNHNAEIQKNRLLISFKASYINYIIYCAFFVLLALNLIWIILTEVGSTHLYGLGKFYFDLENSVPTYFSAIILLFSSILLAIISAGKIKVSDQFSKQWLILSILFLILSVDEVAGFHEIVIDPLNYAFHFQGYWRFSWVIPALILGFILLIFYLRFLNSLTYKYKWGFIIAGFIYVLGGIFVEMLSAKIFINDLASARDLTYNLVITLEESCEMLGVIIFIGFLLSYVRNMLDEISISMK